MPFDSTGFPERRSPPSRPTMSDNEACALILIVFALLMLTPFSMAALVDLVCCLRGG
jgi:hypothetical protein